MRLQDAQRNASNEMRALLLPLLLLPQRRLVAPPPFVLLPQRRLVAPPPFAATVAQACYMRTTQMQPASLNRKCRRAQNEKSRRKCVQARSARAAAAASCSAWCSIASLCSTACTGGSKRGAEDEECGERTER